MGWIGVDLDGTLAEYGGASNIGGIGKPVPAMMARVKEWLAKGIEVRIVTARVGATGLIASGESELLDDEPFAGEQRVLIRAWLLEHLGRELPITASKDFAMLELWDDRVVQVEMNTGRPIGYSRLKE